MSTSTTYVLAIDQGTTSTRAIVFDRDGLHGFSDEKVIFLDELYALGRVSSCEVVALEEHLLVAVRPVTPRYRHIPLPIAIAGWLGLVHNHSPEFRPMALIRMGRCGDVIGDAHNVVAVTRHERIAAGAPHSQTRLCDFITVPRQASA